jgi:hypothetical protein
MTNPFQTVLGQTSWLATNYNLSDGCQSHQEIYPRNQQGYHIPQANAYRAAAI